MWMIHETREQIETHVDLSHLSRIRVLCPLKGLIIALILCNASLILIYRLQ